MTLAPTTEDPQIAGPATYPPDPIATLGLNLILISNDCIRDIHNFKGNNKFSKFNFLEKPFIHIDLNLNPNLGTNLPSILDLVPINIISESGSIFLILSATAIAGKRCPPVPPPAKRNR